MNYYTNRGGNFLSSIPQVTRFLLVANIVIFLADMFLGGMLRAYGSLSNFQPFRLILQNGDQIIKEFQAYQLITHMFLHGGFGHIFMNMFGLYMFGRVLENTLNSKRFFILYFVSGFGAAAIQLLVNYFLFDNSPGHMVGASGAIFGVVTAFAVLYPNVELMIIPIPVPIKAKYLIPGFIVLSFYLGLANRSGDIVAHFAHLGGAIFGFILIKFWKRNQFRQF